jgi:hypothetical protein
MRSLLYRQSYNKLRAYIKFAPYFYFAVMHFDKFISNR